MYNARLTGHLQTIERARLTLRLLRDPRVATWMKALLPVVAALYVLLPIDLIPDVILGLGQVDDLSILGVAVFAMTRLLPKFAPADVVAEHLDDLRGGRRAKRRAPEDVIDAEFSVVDRPASTSYEQARPTQRGNGT